MKMKYFALLFLVTENPNLNMHYVFFSSKVTSYLRDIHIFPDFFIHNLNIGIIVDVLIPDTFK